MSRTYHHGTRAKRRRFPEFHYAGMPPAEPTPPKRKRASMPWFWLRSAPSAWHNIMHTRPWRARGKAEVYREIEAMCLHWYFDDGYAPAHAACPPGAYRRPKVYYW